MLLLLFADFTNNGQSDVLLAINGTVKSDLKGSHMSFFRKMTYMYIQMVKENLFD